MTEIEFFGEFIVWANNWDGFNYERADFKPKQHVLKKYREAATQGTHGVLGWAASLNAHNRQALIDLVRHTGGIFI